MKNKDKKILNLQDDWKEKTVSIQQLLLDEENIRLDLQNKSQDAVITDLFINEKAMEILESIYKNGFFPDETPVVIESNKKYIVIDGNRRVVALKAMFSPKIAPKKFEARIAKMMKNYIPIDKIRVVVVPNREKANYYLAAKHTKTTRRPWSALRRAYFYYAQKEGGVNIETLIERYENKDIPKYIKMYEMQRIALSLDNISDNVRQEVSSKDFEISTLERLYSDKYVQNKLGINFNPITGEVSVSSSQDFDKAFSKIVTDIVEKRISSRQEIKETEGRKKYIDSFLKDSIKGTQISADKFKPKKIIRASVFGIIPKEIVSTLGSPAIDRVIEELQEINYTKFPNITTDALRSLLEAILKKYFDRIGNSIQKKRGSNYIYLQDALSHTKKYFEIKNNKEMIQIIDRIQSNKEFLEMINHNPSIFSTPTETKDSWDRMSELIIFLFNDIKIRKENSK